MKMNRGYRRGIAPQWLMFNTMSPKMDPKNVSCLHKDILSDPILMKAKRVVLCYSVSPQEGKVNYAY